ncbi:MAG: hypothetical protein EOO92_13910 [Pedobacter sp.]|nr:MAG: hypothetical protein EOO92_13910 [Pedobacter sp.]
MALFYGFYHFFLRKLTFFSINRFYLVATLLISLIIPALQFQVQSSAQPPEQIIEASILNTTITNVEQSVTVPKNSSTPKIGSMQTKWDWKKIAAVIYWSVFGGVLLSLLSQIVRVLSHTKHINQKIGKLNIIYKNEGFTNCSFLNYVFVNQKRMNQEEIDQIIKHESIHVMCAHSADKIIISLFKALFWFNPVIYLYEYALEQVHEYEADKETSLILGNTSYANLLLSIAAKKNNPVLVHSFVKHPLKERIQMLFANESKSIKKLSYIAVFPIAITLTYIFGIQVVYANIREISLSKAINITPEEDIDFIPAITLNELKANKITSQQQPTDSLLMVDYKWKSKNDEIYIDGKLYNANILYRISPRCISSMSSKDGKLSITTPDNEIIYANEIDRYNRMIHINANAKKTFYARYTLKNQDGGKSDWIRISMDGRGGSGGGGVGLKKGAEVLLFIDGKRYHESVLKTIGDEYSKGYEISFYGGLKRINELSPDLKNKYDAMIDIRRPIFPLPLSYSADTTTTEMVDGQKIIYLNGRAKFTFQQSTITSDNIILDYKNMTGIAKAGTVTYGISRFSTTGTMDSLHFSLKNGNMTPYGYNK